jgi:geranylgeranyl reductase family protein
MLDVVIVGGGPAGLYAGWKLARGGFRVALFEEHPTSGRPVHCTGVLAADAFDEFGLPDDSVLNQLRAVQFHAPSGDTIDYATPTVEAVVIDRAQFDRRLAERAALAGAQLSYGERVIGVDIDAGGVRVTTPSAAVHAQVCVLACGASYAVQRKLRLGMPRLLLHSAQAELPAGELGAVEVHFGERVAPHGFAWAVPVQRERPYVRIGVMCSQHADRHFDRMFDKIAPRWGVDPAARCQPRQKILPLGPIERTFADRVVVLGDAAGIVKPTTGGGIYYSLLTASLAADTLAAALAADSRALSAYRNTWRKAARIGLRWQLVLRRIAHLTDRDRRPVRIARTDGRCRSPSQPPLNRHRDFIVALLKRPPARRVLFRAALARGRPSMNPGGFSRRMCGAC